MDPLLRGRLLSSLPTKLLHLFGTTEAGIVAGDCPAQGGMHVNADQVLLECLKDAPPVHNGGRRGHAVITTLTRRAMPLIRYKSGDIISLAAVQMLYVENSPGLLDKSWEQTRPFDQDPDDEENVSRQPTNNPDLEIEDESD